MERRRAELVAKFGPRRSGEIEHRPVHVEIDEEPTRRFKDTERGARIGVPRVPLIDPDSNVFTMGSCFAENVRAGLRDVGVATSPDYDSLELDFEHQTAGGLGYLNYYDSFAIRQEFERILDPDPRGYPPVAAEIEPSLLQLWEFDARWQDPHRHDVLAADEDAMADLTEKLDALHRSSMTAADVFILTLGLVECWVDTVTGHFAWSLNVRRRSPDPDRFRFHLSTFEENRDNVVATCRLIGEHFPGRPVVLTVSPVGLVQTFTDHDIGIANTYSKSLLRTVAGAVADDLDGVYYWPSYEIAMREDLFADDGRHVTDEGVARIVDAFIRAHGPESAVSPAAG